MKVGMKWLFRARNTECKDSDNNYTGPVTRAIIGLDL